jgi:integrase
VRGHLYRRGQTWTYVIDVGRESSGRRRQRSKGGYRTRREAEAALHAALNALQQGVYVEPAKLTLAEFLNDSWLPAVKGSLRPTTYSSYETHVRCYLVPAFGDRKLQQLTPPMINALYGELIAGWRDRRPPGPATVRRIHATLHRALRDAVRWQLVARNAASAADPPKAPRPRMTVWTPDQLQVFLEATRAHRNQALWLFYVLTGVRRGEALALQWSDLDLAAGTATIRRSLVPVDHRLVFGEPKTDKGRRRISLDARLVAALRKHHRAQMRERLLVGPAFEDQDLVFCHPDGRPLRPEQVSRWFSALARRSGLPPIRLHDLRHLHATLALSAGVAPRVLADRLGHSSTAMTTDIYQHVLPDLDRDAAGRVAAIVFSPTPANRDRGSSA